MNFRKEAVASIMASLNWATADEDYTPSRWLPYVQNQCTDLLIVVASSEPPAGKFKSDGQRTRLNKRKVASDALMQTREELFNGEFDGYVAQTSFLLRLLTQYSLIVASEYDPYSIIEKLYPYLAGSASIVVHSPHVQVVTSLHNQLRDRQGYLGPTVTETWLRQYQVRSHTLPLSSISIERLRRSSRGERIL